MLAVQYLGNTTDVATTKHLLALSWSPGESQQMLGGCCIGGIA